MPDNKQLYSEFADLTSLENQKKEILAIFNEVKTGITTLAEVGVKIDNSKSIRQIQVAEKEYNAELKQTQLFVKQLADTEAKLVLVRQKETLQLTENKLRLKELNKEQAERIKLQNAEEGSIEKLELQYAKAYRIFKQLGDEQRNSTRGVTLNKYLEDTANKLNELKKSAGNFSANVGRYGESLAKPFETLIKKVQELKANLAKGVGIGGNDSAAIERANKAIQVIEKTITKASGANSTSVTQVKNLSNAYQDLAITIGKAGGTSETSFLNKLGAQVGEAKDSVQDLKDQLKLNASDTKGIDNVVGSLNALAGIAQGAAGAYALLGANQEDAARVTAKLMAVQGIANSIQTVGQELTRKGTIANKIYEFSLNTMTTAFGKGSTAAARFNAILKVGVIGLVITGIILLISKMAELGNETDDLAESMKAYGEGVKDATLQTNKVKAAFDQAKAGVISKNAALKIYNDTLGDSFGKTNDLNKAEQLYNEKASVYIQIMGLKAQANALFAKSAEEAAKGITASSEDQTSGFTKAKTAVLAYLGLTNKAINVAIKDQAEGVVDAQKKAKVNSDKLYDEALKKANDAQKLSDQFKIKTDKPEKTEVTKAKKINDNTAATILKEQFEQNKLIIEAAAERDRKIVDDETKTYEERISALRNFTSNQMALVELEQQFQADQEMMRLDSVKKSLEEEKKEKGANIKAINAQIVKEETASNETIKTLTLKGANDLLKIGQDFNKELKSLSDARNDIRREEQKQIEDYNEWTLNEEKRLKKLLSDFNKKNDQDEADRQQKAIDDAKGRIKEQYKALYSEILATVSFFLTLSIDKEMAALETRKRMLDEETARRINQINMLGFTETERIKQTAIVEKQAAYEKEQIDKRQRRLNVERAKYEKAANIASIIGNTAAAVVKALKDAPYPYNIILAALIGATGALQLARAVAAPLPQYYTGTDSAAPGDAWIGEKGSELMERDGRWFLSPSKATKVKMKGGERVIPADLTRDIMNSMSFGKLDPGGMTIIQSGMSSEQADKLIDEIKDLKKETAKNRMVLNIGSGIEFEMYIQKNIK